MAKNNYAAGGMTPDSSEPEGYSDFLAEPSDSDSPQTAMAEQGFKTIGKAALESEPVQNIITGKGLKDYDDILKRAARGDEAAKFELAQRSLGTAMGSIQGIKPAPLGAIEPAPMYSKLQKTIQEKMGGSATAEQINGMLSGIKGEERQYSGLDSFLQGKDKVNKSELLSHVQANEPQIKTITKGGSGEPNIQTGATVYDVMSPDGEGVATFLDEGAAKRYARSQGGGHEVMSGEYDGQTLEDVDMGTSGGTKFSQYTLPGGENYKETLYQLPEKNANKFTSELDPKSDKILIKDPQGKVVTRYSSEDAEGAQAYISHMNGMKGANEGSYQSSHYDEPNILAHTRTNERTDAAGNRHLFIEEVQSDWHQAGRKEGYGSSPEREYKTQKLRTELERLDPATQEYENKADELHNILQNPGGVPDAPYKKTWHEYALKRTLHDAVKSGHDNISWTTGAQQADRYDLSKSISHANLKPHNDGTFTLSAGDHSGNTVLTQKLKRPEEAEQYIGKDATQKLMASELQGGMHSISGPDLKVGGEGMKGFYDKIIPDYMNKIGKKYGTKVETAELATKPETNQYGADISHKGADRTPSTQTVHTMRITPEMRATILKEGLPTYEAGGLVGQPTDFYAEGGEVEAPAGYDDYLNNSTQPGSMAPEGYDEFIAPELKAQTYGSTSEMLKTFAEGAGQGVAGPLAPMIEQGAGVAPQSITGRQETNPGMHAMGEMTGLAGSMLTGVGLGSLATKAGGAAAKTLLPSISSRLGSAAVKAAVENLAIASSDETTKMVLGNPNQTAQTALVDVGLSTVLGGALGATGAGVGALWKSTMGAKTGGILKALADKAGGVEGAATDAVNDTIETSGMTVSPEVRATLSQDPAIQHMFQTLQESSTRSGLKAQTALKDFKNDLGNQVVRNLGMDPEAVGSLSELSEYDAGTNIKKALASTLKANMDPISASYESIQSRFKDTILDQADIGNLATRVGEMSSTEGFNLSPSSPQAKVIARVLEELPNLKTLEDVRKYTSIIGDTTMDPEMWRIGSRLRKIFRTTEEETLDKTIGSEAPELLGQHTATRAAYKSAMENIDSLNDRLHVGRYAGPKSFLSALGDMDPETVLRRLSPKGDAGIIGELSARFPQVASQLKDYHVSQILKGAAGRAATGELINSKALFTTLSKLSPEMRSFLMPGKAADTVEALESLLTGLPSKMNTSGTAKALDSLMSHVPGSSVGMIAAIHGHGIAGMVLAPLIKAIGRDIPDAAKLGLLKYLGSSEPMSTTGFKSMVDYIHQAVSGERLLNKSTKALFTAGREVLAQNLQPTKAERDKLDKYLSKIQQDPTKLVGVGDHTGSYMRDHGTAISQVAMQAANYLNSKRPVPHTTNPLDTKMPPTPIQKADYDRALDIAQQPLIVLNKIKSGTIIPKDVEAIRTMYPDLYKSMSSKLYTHISEAVHKGKEIPYHTRQGLSLFLGTRLDSTFEPQAIMTIQSVGQTVKAAAQQAAMPAPAKKTSGLNKLPDAYRTPSQTTENRHAAPK